MLMFSKKKNWGISFLLFCVLQSWIPNGFQPQTTEDGKERTCRSISFLLTTLVPCCCCCFWHQCFVVGHQDNKKMRRRRGLERWELLAKRFFFATFASVLVWRSATVIFILRTTRKKKTFSSLSWWVVWSCADWIETCPFAIVLGYVCHASNE